MKYIATHSAKKNKKCLFLIRVHCRYGEIVTMNNLVTAQQLSDKIGNSKSLNGNLELTKCAI